MQIFRLGAEPGLVLEVLDLGATAQKLWVTGGDGERRNVLLGHATAEEYHADTAYLGATVGRYANRIRGGTFPLAGTTVRVGAHDRGNHLHGGPDGFDRRTWDVVAVDATTATFELVSPDGDQGFPGELTARATYTVEGDTVRIDLSATTDATTVVNLTNHSYFNLAGDGSGTVDEHVLRVDASRYTPVDANAIPDGDHRPVDGTPFDLRAGRRLGDVIRSDHEQVALCRGIDHNFLVDGDGLRTVASLESRRTGTRLDLSSDQPGLQVYTGNFLDGSTFSSVGVAYRQGDGIALEPQKFPDTPNRPDFGSAVLEPGDTYRSTITWQVRAVR